MFFFPNYERAAESGDLSFEKGQNPHYAFSVSTAILCERLKNLYCDLMFRR